MTEHPFEPGDHGDPAPPSPDTHHDSWPGWAAPEPELHLDPHEALFFFAAAADENERHDRPDPDAGNEARSEPAEPAERAEPAEPDPPVTGDTPPV